MIAVVVFVHCVAASNEYCTEQLAILSILTFTMIVQHSDVQ